MKNNSIKKILVIAESIDLEDSSGTKGRVALIQNLQKVGFEVIVYHYTRKEIQLQGIKCVAIKENRKSLLFLIGRLERHVRKKTKLNLNSYIEKRFGFSLTFFNDSNSIARGLRFFGEDEPDLVLTLSKGASFRPHHALLDLPRWHDKWMAYIHDPYPFASYPRPYDYVEPGHQQKREFFLKVAKRAKYAAYPSKLLAEWMESYYPSFKGKAVVIPHQINENEVADVEVPDFFKKNAFTIVHAGALMGARNPMSLVRAFENFLRETPESGDHSQLLFLGDRSRYSEDFQKINKEVPQIYSSEAYLPFKIVLAIQKNAAVNVILEAKGLVSPFLPGKFPHCVQAGKPVLLLGPYYSESRRLLGESYPWWSEIDDEERIFKILCQLYQNWKISNKDIGYQSKILIDYLSTNYLSKRLSKL